MNILYIACGSGCDQTMGGSLYRSIEIAKRLSSTHTIKILTSTGGKTAIASYFNDNAIIEFKTLLCSINNEQNFFIKQAVSYLLIFLKTIPRLLTLPKFEIVYLDSDGLWDVIPATVYKLRHPSTRIVSMNHHKVSLRREGKKSLVFSFINIMMQITSYFFLRFIADALLVLDTHMGDVIREEFTRLGYKKPIISVRDGLDTKLLAAVPDQKTTYEACFFGYLRPSKGLYDIVPIWLQVTQKLPTARLVIIGGMLPEYREHLLEGIEKNNLQNNIIVKDYIPDKKEAVKLVKQSRIFISPSHEEGWGISIMECLGSGIPGVVWELPTYDRIFHQGLIKITQYKIPLFAEAIVQLLTNDQQYSKLQKETVTSVKKYDWDIIAETEMKIFTKLSNKHSDS